MMTGEHLSLLQRIGRDLFLRGLVGSHSGNLSLRLEQHLLITRHGAMLGHLEAADLVAVGLHGNPEATPQPSYELPVHRAIYRATPARAIVHAHPPYAIALSLEAEEICPADAEGAYLLGRVPVLGAPLVVESPLAAELLPPLLAAHRACLIQGHGSFSAGASLEEAYQWASVLEESCHILWLLQRRPGPGA